jgi:hypothetical protein
MHLTSFGLATKVTRTALLANDQNHRFLSTPKNDNRETDKTAPFWVGFSLAKSSRVAYPDTIESRSDWKVFSAWLWVLVFSMFQSTT